MASKKNLATLIPFSEFCGVDKERDIAITKDLMALPIFYRLNEKERKTIASITRRGNYLKDDIIFKQDQPGGQLFVLYQGEVEINRIVRDRQSRTVAKLKSGDIFGEETLILGDKHTSSAVCTTDCEVFIIDKVDFDWIVRENPVLATKILNLVTLSLCSHLHKISARIWDMVNYVTSHPIE